MQGFFFVLINILHSNTKDRQKEKFTYFALKVSCGVAHSLLFDYEQNYMKDGTSSVTKQAGVRK